MICVLIAVVTSSCIIIIPFFMHIINRIILFLSMHDTLLMLSRGVADCMQRCNQPFTTPPVKIVDKIVTPIERCRVLSQGSAKNFSLNAIKSKY